MLIERIQVEEGFLDGLDLRFTAGLNVLIGPRGSGKTSVIELIRFCLSVPGMTSDQGAKATRHAVEILGTGQVTVTLKEHGETIRISRTIQEKNPRATASFQRPLIVSQSEIEEIGVQATSRLELIDRFRPRFTDRLAVADVAMIRSLTAEVQSTLEDLAKIDDELAQLTNVSVELQNLLNDQAAVLGQLTAKQEEQQRLSSLTDEIGGANVRRDLIEVTRKELTDWHTHLTTLVSRENLLPTWPASARTDDWFEDARQTLAQCHETLRTAARLSAEVITSLDHLSQKNHGDFVRLESEARNLRSVLESVQAGAGEIQRRIGTLKTQEARLGALQTRRMEKTARLLELKQRRGKLLDELEDSGSRLFAERLQAAQSINADLGPEIRVEVRQASRHDDYRSMCGLQKSRKA
jgi:DNA repair exonuclease SbcCD ATPase subunit